MTFYAIARLTGADVPRDDIYNYAIQRTTFHRSFRDSFGAMGELSNVNRPVPSSLLMSSNPSADIAVRTPPCFPIEVNRSRLAGRSESADSDTKTEDNLDLGRHQRWAGRHTSR